MVGAKKVAFTPIPVRDMAAAEAFYGGLLGLPRDGSAPGSRWVEYDLPGGGCVAITTVAGTPGGGAGPRVALEVEDLDVAVAAVKAHGARLLTEHVKGPRCRMAVVADPDGNAILLHQLDRP